MSIHALKKGQIDRPQKQLTDTFRIPAPLKGIDSRIATIEGGLGSCLYTYNLLPAETGMQVRGGYREYQIGLDLGASVGVHTIVPFNGPDPGSPDDKLFAVTNEGIWDVTTDGGTPILKATFADQDPDAGYGTFSRYVNDAERDVLFYADSKNGLFEYDAILDTWAQSADINGPVIEDVRWVVSHKQRLWLVEENATKAWYLGIGSTSGMASEFFFGSKFRWGGNLAGLFNWSVDGGDGVDDYLVAVSRSGDVLPFRGDDPALDSWQLVGTYYIGEVPPGPNFGSQDGGVLLLLSIYGVTSMNDLLNGVNTVLGVQGETNPTEKITGIIREEIRKTVSENGWSIRTLPSQGAMLIQQPKTAAGVYLQYYYNKAMNAWGFVRGVPIESFENWQGKVMVGDADSRMLYLDAKSDNVLLTPPEDKENGEPIEFSVLTTFSKLGGDALFKHVTLIRPDFIGNARPTFNVAANYDYSLQELVQEPSNPTGSTGTWDVSTWDSIVWGTSSPEPLNKLSGSWDYGRYVAIAMSGKTRDELRFIGWDIIYTVGGPLL